MLLQVIEEDEDDVPDEDEEDEKGKKKKGKKGEIQYRFCSGRYDLYGNVTLFLQCHSR